MHAVGEILSWQNTRLDKAWVSTMAPLPCK